MSWLSSIVGYLLSLIGFKSNADPTQVAQIQAAAVKACGFLPMAESVAALLAAGNPAIMSAATMANQICSVVMRAPTPASMQGLMGAEASVGGAAPAPTWGTVNGVPIQGVFIK